MNKEKRALYYFTNDTIYSVKFKKKSYNFTQEITNKFCKRTLFTILSLDQKIIDLINRTHYFSLIDQEIKKKELNKFHDVCNYEELNGSFFFILLKIILFYSIFYLNRFKINKKF